MKRIPIQFESFHKAHERIFGKKEIPSNEDGINRQLRRIAEQNGQIHQVDESKIKISTKPQLCPHCATMNRIQKTRWEVICHKCGWDKA